MRGQPIIVLLLLWCGLSRCGTSISEIGSGFFSNKSPFELSSLDSSTLELSTIVLADSVPTSNAQQLLVGFHQDERLGTLTTQGVVRLNAGAPGLPDKKTTEFVGLRLSIKKNGYSYYDTTQLLTLTAYQLTAPLVSRNQQFYNTHDFSIDTGNPLGSITIEPRPYHTKDSLEIPLPDALGQEIFTMAQNGDPRLTDNQQFWNFFNGLAIVSDTTVNGAILGLNSHVEMRVYFNDRAQTPIALRYFSFSTGSYYSTIHAWREGTKVSSLKKRMDEVASTLTDNESYIQSGMALGIRIEMPFIHTLRSIDPEFICTSAILELVPTKPSYQENPLPKSLSLYIVDRQNNFLSPASLPVGLSTDYEYGRNTHYYADVSPFINAQLGNLINNHNALLLRANDDQTGKSIGRVYIGDQLNQYTAKLKLFYLTLPNQQN